MPTRTLLSLLLSAAVACTADQPTELKPEFAVGCQAIPRLLATPSTVTQAPQTSAVASFVLTNRCPSSENYFLISSRTGSVATVTVPNPSDVFLNSNQSTTVTVSYTTGALGQGTVSLKATLEATGVSQTAQLFVTVAQGVPFGPFDLFKNSTTPNQLAPFNLNIDIADSAGIVGTIDLASRNHINLVTQMTGGSHARYLDSTTTPPKFSFTKWKNALNKLKTPTIIQAVGNGVANGTILFDELMDEPNHPSWGPKGTVTHALLDSMSRYEKGIFPTLRTGVVVKWNWDSTSVYQSVDVIVSQYGLQTQSLTPQAYRDSAVASARRQNVGLMFSMNVLDGGKKVSPCPAGTGPAGNTCRMTATELTTYGDVLVAEPFACGLAMWTWDSGYFGDAAIESAFSHLANSAAGRVIKACGK